MKEKEFYSQKGTYKRVPLSKKIKAEKLIPIDIFDKFKSKGSYFLNNKNVGELSDNKLAEIRNLEVGFVFQTFNLLPRMNALDNVALPLIYAGYAKDDRVKLAKKALEEVGLSDRVYHKPNELSGGQRQRVAMLEL